MELSQQREMKKIGQLQVGKPRKEETASAFWLLPSSLFLLCFAVFLIIEMLLGATRCY
jgi:hypothetical protein